MIFLQGLTYLIDVYLANANSAISANVFVRSWFAAGLTMFATPMYHKLGVSLNQFSNTEVNHMLIADAGDLGNKSTQLLRYYLFSSVYTFLCIRRKDSEPQQVFSKTIKLFDDYMHLSLFYSSMITVELVTA